jgi:hypothetical protein
VVIPDNDPTGERHAQQVAQALRNVAADVKILRLPGLSPSGDASDWLDAGHTVEDLLLLADQVQPWRPPAAPTGAPQLLTAAEILDAADAPGPEWLVEGLLSSGGVSVFAGRPKSGKSTLVRALAVAVAQGRPFLGRATQQGAVLLITLEDRKRSVARHLRHLGLRADDPLLVATAGDADTVARWVEEHQPVLVIVDTVARLLQIREVSEYGKVLEALDAALRMARDSGAHFALIHHAPKGSDHRDPIDAPLGSVAFAATPDTLLHLKRGADGARAIAAVQREGDDLEESVLVLGADGWPVLAGTKREHATRQMAEEVLAYLSGREGMTRDEIRADVPGDNTVKGSALDLLVREGKIQRSGAGRRGDPYRYSVLPSGLYTADGKTEMKNGPEPASELAESRLRFDGGLATSPDGIQTETPPPSLPWSPPDGPCHACGRARFWSSVPGHLTCAVCHPPGDEALVRLWWVRRPSGKWLALRRPGEPARYRIAAMTPGIRARCGVGGPLQ